MVRNRLMNLFILDLMPVTAATYYCDRHVVKIILEAVEMMGFAYDQGEFKPLPWLKHARHYNHPMSVWVRSSLQNFDWTYQHAVALCCEYTYRYDKVHSYLQHIDWIGANLPLSNLSDMGRTDWPRCFGPWKEKVGITDDIVQDYRRYYMLAKRFATWKKRNIPYWFV